MTMTDGESLQVLVCDDDPDRVEKWVDTIRGALPDVQVSITALSVPDFANAFMLLQDRREVARGISTPTYGDAADPTVEAMIDNADLMILDYDLSPARDIPDAAGDTLTELSGKSGEDFAYLLRCFSPAKGIVILNQRVQRPVFDLTMQRFVDSMADLNVSSKDLHRRSLWVGESDDGDYRPWSWFPLLKLPALVRRRTGLMPGLDDLVFAALGFDERHLDRFAPEQLDPLGVAVEKLTFKDMATRSAWGLAGHDADGAVDDAQLASIAACAVGRWLDAVVVPAQNVLIDEPHLIQRFPQFATGPDPGQQLTITDERLQVASVPAVDWCSRRCWSVPLVHDLARDFGIDRPAKREVAVFCEDTSTFEKLADATEFRSGLPRPFDRRFVAMRASDVEFQPVGRLQD